MIKNGKDVWSVETLLVSSVGAFRLIEMGPSLVLCVCTCAEVFLSDRDGPHHIHQSALNRQRVRTVSHTWLKGSRATTKPRT